MGSQLKYKGFEKPLWWYVCLLAMAGVYLVAGVLLLLGIQLIWYTILVYGISLSLFWFWLYPRY